MVCLSKQETSEGARWALWKRGRNPRTRHTDSQPDSYIYSQPATTASLWSEGLLGPTDQLPISRVNEKRSQQYLLFDHQLQSGQFNRVNYKNSTFTGTFLSYKPGHDPVIPDFPLLVYGCSQLWLRSTCLTLPTQNIVYFIPVKKKERG